MRIGMKALCGALAVAVVAVACGGTEDEAFAQGEDALSSRTAGYVTLRKDTRRCASPMCGGYFVRELKGGSETYVSGLDFSNSGLDDDAQGDVVEAADGEVIVKGKLGPQERVHKTRALLVTDAWRGMPGMHAASGDKFYTNAPRNPQVQCFVAPCPNLTASQVGSSTKTDYATLDLTAALPSFASRDWLENRAIHGGAIVAAKFRTGTAQTGKTLAASQVFVKLPETIGSCPQARLAACPTGQVWSYTRNADRCVLPEQCVPQRACPYMLPHCPDGYTQQFWSHNGCTVSACDPTFSVPEQQ